MDPSSWYYNRLQAGQPGSSGLTGVASGAPNPESVFQPGAYAAPGSQHPFILAQQLRYAQLCYQIPNSLWLIVLSFVCRDAAAAHEVAQYQNMALPPSLVQAAASNKTHLHQQALVNLNSRESFLTPPQTPVTAGFGYKQAVSVANSVVVPEPHKPDPRAIVNNVRGNIYSHHDILANGNGGLNPNHAVTTVSASSSSGRPNVMRQAVELKSSQPVFPGQPPPSLARTENRSQPPPRQSSQVRSSVSASSTNRTAFPGQAPPQAFRGENSFLHDLAGHHRSD